jgi:hypothetical protein
MNIKLTQKGQIFRFFRSFPFLRLQPQKRLVIHLAQVLLFDKKNRIVCNNETSRNVDVEELSE